MKNTPDNTNKPTNKPTPEQPKGVQGDLDNQGCPPLANLLAPDLMLRPSSQNSGTSRRATGKGGGKGAGKGDGGVKRITNSGGITGRLKKPRKPKTQKKITIPKTSMLKRR